MLLPICGHRLQARNHGPYTVEHKINDVDYIVCTPDRRKQRQFCHINMLKPYYTKELNSEMPATVVTVTSLSSGGGSGCTEEGPDSESVNVSLRLNNSATLLNLKQKIQHLSDTESAELEQLIVKFLELFPDVPSRTTVMYHDVMLAMPNQ